MKPSGEALALVRDSRSGQEWPADVVLDAWKNTADLINAVMSACASIECVLLPSRQGQFRDHGVIDILYMVDRSIPLAQVAQLWCFRDIDPDGAWIDESSFFVRDVGADRQQAGFTDKAFMEGAPLSGEFMDAVLERGWVRVVRIPIAPHMDMGFPVHRHPVVGEYEIVGVPDEHDVPFVGAL